MNDVQKVNLRLPMHLMEEAKAQAAALGVSLNAYILFAVSEQVKRARRDLPTASMPPKPKRPVRSAVPAWEDPVVTPIKRPVVKVGRNELCPCGSGRKAKHCHPEWT